MATAKDKPDTTAKDSDGDTQGQPDGVAVVTVDDGTTRTATSYDGDGGVSSTRQVDESAPARPGRSNCVVKEDFHVGQAVNGLVCSYHANRFDAQGNPRVKKGRA